MTTAEDGLPQPFGPPVLEARTRVAPEDFRVEEIDAFPASGSGEHLLLTVEKRGMNTAFAARLLASWAGVPERAVGYAGLKDRHAVTVQRFSVHLPGRPDPDPSSLEAAGLELARCALRTWVRELHCGLAGRRHARARLHIAHQQLCDRPGPSSGFCGRPREALASRGRRRIVEAAPSDCDGAPALPEGGGAPRMVTGLCVSGASRGRKGMSHDCTGRPLCASA